MKYDSNGALLATSIPGLPEPHRGKVRDIYDLGDSLLFVATDRISAFDCVMPNGIPDKGKVLTQMSLFWFELLSWMPNHLLCWDAAQFPASLKAVAGDLAGRSLIVKKARTIPLECIVRGYLIGSGWKDYRKNGRVCGIPAARRISAGSEAGGTAFHAVDESRQRTMTRISVSRPLLSLSAGKKRRKSANVRFAFTRKPRRMLKNAALFLRIPSLNSETSTVK